MIIDLNVFFIIQGVNTTLAVIFNLFLAYLAIFKCKNRHGSYQTIVIVYALFEALYAIVTFIGMPVGLKLVTVYHGDCLGPLCFQRNLDCLQQSWPLG